MLSNDSVWSSTQHKPVNGTEVKRPNRGNVLGRLVAITATGPTYKGRADVLVVPVSVGLAFTQELAARAINPRARVVSSLANRVGGDTASSVWMRTCAFSTSALIGASPRARLVFLNQVLTYVRRQENVNGIEPILAAAVNAAWPWIEPIAFARILAFTSKYLRKSEFSATTAIPVLDPNTRTVTLFAPGALAKIDPAEWLDRRDLSHGGFMSPSQLGGTGLSDSDLNALERLLGHGGPSLDGLKGPKGNGLPGGGNSDLLNALERLLGHGGPSLDGLKGPKGNGLPSGGGDSDQINELERLLGHGGLDLSNLGGNGGPYGYGSGLGHGGAATPNDAEKTAGVKAQQVGLFIAGAGVSAALVGSPYLGAALIGFGAGVFIVGAIHEIIADKEKPGPAEPAPTGSTPPAKTEEPKPIDVHKLPDAKPKPEEPKPEEPKHNDLYPDPDGTGGGNPTRLPDSEGGGGNPTTIWDENGGGGNPATIWDENGGGGNPTTAKFVNATVLTGPGLLAGVVQVGPATFAF